MFPDLKQKKFASISAVTDLKTAELIQLNKFSFIIGDWFCCTLLPSSGNFQTAQTAELDAET